MFWSDLPPPGTLVAFEATVRHASISRAAAELHLTHGAVSRQIQHLERVLGVRLFERRNRAIVATPAATTFAATVADVLGQLTDAARRVQRGARPAPLVLSCEPTLLMRWLIPRLPTLSQSVPELEVHLSAAGPLQFDRQGIDLAIRRNDFPLPKNARAGFLFDERIGPVCTPELAARLTTTDDLAMLPRLHSRTRPDAWTDWATRHAVPLPPAPEQTYEHFYLSLQAASAGLGVAIGPLALVHDDLAVGKLVAPFGFVPDGSSYLLLTHRDDERVPALIDWLRDQVATLTGDPVSGPALGPRSPAAPGRRKDIRRGDPIANTHRP